MFAIVQLIKGTTTTAVQRRIEKLHAERGKIRETISLAVADRAAAIKAMQADLDDFLSMDRTF